MRALSLVPLLTLLACGKGDEAPLDLDRDGVPATEDCDDLDATVFPGAEERCDGVDNDCDGEVDDTSVDAITFYADADQDGYGDAATSVTGCELPEGFVGVAGDCDDQDPAFHPGAPEADCADPADYNCDGSTGYADVDGDGVPACQDCDDARAEVSPGAEEVCDGLDNDCDTQVDEDASDASAWYPDLDGDGFGNPRFPLAACEAPEGYLADGTDCDDLSAVSLPGGEEVCDGQDNDCDGQVDEEAADALTWYVDRDGDRYGDDATAASGCQVPQGAVLSGGDCDDQSATAHPGAAERCDGADDDCDGQADVGALDAPVWYADADGDGFGDRGDALRQCEAPAGRVDNALDCDDTEPRAWTGAAERCDGVDNDCDGAADLGAVDAGTWYADQDADRHGDPAHPTRACVQPAGTVALADDCDDAEPLAWTGAAEVCDGVDNDCDGEADDGLFATWYLDADGDGYGDPTSATDTCDPGDGSLLTAGDCDDGEATTHPGATDGCDGVDNDCDGTVDNGLLDTWYLDADGDGYGDPSSATSSCDPGEGYVRVAGDCDDGEATVYLGAAERCDGLDNDCDEVVPEDEGDGDEDGLLDCEDEVFGSAMSFASGQYVLVSDSTALHLSGAHTLEAWFKTTAGESSENAVIGKHSGGYGNGWFLGFNSYTATPYAAQYYVTSDRITGGVSLNDGAWHHLAGTWDGARSILYVDGVEVGRRSHGAFAHNSLPVMIGGYGAGANYEGLLDEVRLWSVARSASDLASSKDAPLSGMEAGLEVWYDFNGGSGQIVEDRSPNGRDGVMGASTADLIADPSWVEDAPF
ncbi:MAG: hypothetical protein JXX28_19335 [Deltaproteobacteria bacterium]|nr:hypothetical protein [Deltaproteobacteria bacterium]